VQNERIFKKQNKDSFSRGLDQQNQRFKGKREALFSRETTTKPVTGTD